MAKSETLWRCSTCDKLYGSEKDALKCDERHALFLEIQTISDNPTFIDTTQDNYIIREDITNEEYHTDVKNPKSLDDINTVIDTTYSTVVRRDIYQRSGAIRYNPKIEVFEFKED